MEKKKKSALVPILWILVAGVLGLGGFQIGRLYNRPMAKSLVLPTETSSSVALPLVAANIITPTAEPFCGNTGTMSVLFTGADYSKGVWPFGADSVRFIKVDFDQQKVTVISFPRDLIVTVDGTALENRGDQSLGLSYYYEELATVGEDKDKILAGTQLIAKTLYKDYEIKPDHYLTLELRSLEDLFTAVGNVEIDNPQAFISDSGVNFPKGKQILTPDLAEEYVRSYDPDGDVGRIARQNLFIEAFRDKAVSVGIIPQVPQLLKQFSEVITTDLSPKQLVDLACVVEKVDKAKIEFYEIEGPDLVLQGTDYQLIPKIEAIKAFIKKALETP